MQAGSFHTDPLTDMLAIGAASPTSARIWIRSESGGAVDLRYWPATEPERVEAIAERAADSAAQTITGVDAMAVAAGDLDGDGCVDLVTATGSGSPVQVYANIAGPAMPTRRRLSTTPVALGPRGLDHDIALVDLELDGDLDLITAGGAGKRIDLVFGRASAGGQPSNLVFLNMSAGSVGLSATPERLGASQTQSVIATDVDGDRDPDLVFANANGIHQLFANSSRPDAMFAPHTEQIVTGAARSGAVSAFSADDRPGLAVAGPAGIWILLNDGRGNLGRGDREPPVITLRGSAEVSMKLGEPFTDPGATAEDAIDGDVTDRITVEDDVDTSLIGTYSVRYGVTDRSGNAAPPLTRTVRVGVGEPTGGGGGGAFGWLGLGLLGLAALLRQRRRSRSAPWHGTCIH